MKKKAKGKALESRVTKANYRYRRSHKAFILYKGTTVVIHKHGARLEPSPPDYEGLLSNGVYISFDAKETGSTTSFSLSGIRDHQIAHLRLANEFGGLCFFLIHFYNIHADSAYKIPVTFIAEYWDNWKNNEGRASIPLKNLKKDWLVPISNYLEL